LRSSPHRRIPFKKTDQRLIPYLKRQELQAVLDAPDPATRDGVRDRAMLHPAVCAGLRVAEVANLKLRLARAPTAIAGIGLRRRFKLSFVNMRRGSS
jgi:integrase/recombinase XerD